MESLNRNNPEGLVNSSDTLLAPSIDLGFPTNNPQNSSMNSPFPALIDNSVPQLHKLFPNVDENTPTITEATTLADSKHLASQTESQIGNLNIDENHSPDHTSKEVINEKNGIRPFVNSSTSIEETKTISETGNSKEETQNEEEINGGENSQSETKSNKDESELNKASNIDTITQTNNQEKKEVMEAKGINESIPEKEQSLRKISVGDNKSSEISENGNRGFESSAQKQQIPLLALGRGDSANKSEPSDKQFISDQHDSEGYNNSNRKTRESLKDISAPSSGTEEGKEKEVLKNQPIKKPKISLADFQKITLLGRGSYAEVHLVKRVQNQNKIYALKVIDKYFMKKVFFPLL